MYIYIYIHNIINLYVAYIYIYIDKYIYIYISIFICSCHPWHARYAVIRPQPWPRWQWALACLSSSSSSRWCNSRCSSSNWCSNSRCRDLSSADVANRRTGKHQESPLTSEKLEASCWVDDEPQWLWSFEGGWSEQATKQLHSGEANDAAAGEPAAALTVASWHKLRWKLGEEAPINVRSSWETITSLPSIATNRVWDWRWTNYNLNIPQMLAYIHIYTIHGSYG